MSIKEYYDETATFYQKVGINDRNRMIHRLLLRFGLHPKHSVLEIGCGVGVQTQLLAKACRHVTAIDLSPKSIELAKVQYFSLKNVDWRCEDVLESDFITSFDVIVLPDVLHYIPENQHIKLFLLLKKWLSPNGFIFIHSPSAEFVEWSRANDPTKLNLDDIALDNQGVMKNAQDNDLHIVHLEQYALWHRGGDYQFIVMRHKNVVHFDTRKLSFWKRLKKKFEL
jgi:trans-aconitate 2-methyltransferase